MGKLIGTPALLMASVCVNAYAQSENAMTQVTQGAASQAAQGAAIVANRTVGLCVLCHAVPGMLVVRSIITVTN